MIMRDYKNSKPAAEKLSAWDYIGAVCFILIMILLIIGVQKMKHYHIWASGFAYCVDEYATSKKVAIAQFKKRWDFKRMPAGSYICLAY